MTNGERAVSADTVVTGSSRICVQPAEYGDRLVDAPTAAGAVRDAGGCITGPERADAAVWLASADVVGLRALLADRPQLRWVQLPMSGPDRFASLFGPDRTWTSCKGAYADPIAEFVLASVLVGRRRLLSYARKGSSDRLPAATLYGANVTILGGGGIATSVLRLLAPYRCRTTVIRRCPRARPPLTATRVLGMTETNLPEVLAETDVLILALALTEETDGLVGAVELAYLPAHAWLVNVARGRHVDTDALTIALQERQIGGAVLDVTEPEPLPWNHPLRQLDNCLVTPHTACTPEIARPRLLERIYDNVQRFVAGRELIGVVDTRAGY